MKGKSAHVRFLNSGYSLGNCCAHKPVLRAHAPEKNGAEQDEKENEGNEPDRN
jgi:hypothetical protein